MTGPTPADVGSAATPFKTQEKLRGHGCHPRRHPASSDGFGPVSSGRDALERGLYEPVDDLDLRLVLARPRVARGMEDPKLVVGTCCPA